MTATPFLDFAERVRWSAVNGKKLHLDWATVRAIAQHPGLMSYLAGLGAEEIARKCLELETQGAETDSPSFDLSVPLKSPTPIAPPPPAASASASSPTTSGSSGAPSASNIQLLDMTGPLVASASSQQASEQARESIRLARLTRRSQRIIPSAPARPRPRPPLRSVSPP